MIDRLDELYRHVADLGLNVEWLDLGDRLRGRFEWWRDVIVLNTRLTQAQATATLAHECGHARFGDTCSTPANEQRAWEYGAAMLITPAEYAAAEAMVGHHSAAIALELDVTPRLVEAWRSWWLTRGQHRHVDDEAGADAPVG